MHEDWLGPGEGAGRRGDAFSATTQRGCFPQAAMRCEWWKPRFLAYGGVEALVALSFAISVVQSSMTQGRGVGHSKYNMRGLN